MDIDYSEKIVAFIDILGYRNLIEQSLDEAKKTIHLVNDVFNHAFDVVKSSNPENIFSIKLFSDCICISSSTEHVYEMLYELSYIQLWFSMYGIFLRGALSSGLHFENKNIIFSQGLVKAYEQESNAIYPRIIIDSLMAKNIPEDTRSKFIMKSPDRLFFIDYLASIYEEGHSEPEKILESHKNAILNQVRENIEDIKIVEKYRWLAEYHNIKANEFIGAPEDWERSYYDELYNQVILPTSRYFPNFNKPSKKGD